MTCPYCKRALMCAWCGQTLKFAQSAYRDGAGGVACDDAPSSDGQHAPLHVEERTHPMERNRVIGVSLVGVDRRFGGRSERWAS